MAYHWNRGWRQEKADCWYGYNQQAFQQKVINLQTSEGYKKHYVTDTTKAVFYFTLLKGRGAALQTMYLVSP